MPEYLNMLDVAKRRAAILGPVVEQVIVNVPELNVFPVRTVKGTSYQTLKRTGLPTVQFSMMNQGFDPSKSTTELGKFECFPFGGRIECDKRVADQYEGGRSAYFAFEAKGITLSSMLTLGRQIFYGAGGEIDKGFPGLKAFLPNGAAQTINAGGTTANTASSVYFVKFGTEDAVSLIAGEDGDIFELREPREETIKDKDGKNMDGLTSQMDGWTGLQVANVYSVGRILNLTNDAGKGLTDKLGYDYRETVPVGWQPDFCFMSRRSLGQLQRSRNPISNNSNQALAYASIPTDLAGIPIIVTDSIVNTDSIEA